MTAKQRATSVPSHAGAQDGMTEVVLLSIGSGLNLLLLMEAP